MTTPTRPQKESLRDRISTRLSTDSHGRYIDDDARRTRDITLAFYGIIALVVLVAIAGLIYGFWESNLKPLATVNGTQVSRAEWEDRQALEAFRLERAGQQVREALVTGAIASGLADRRFADAAAAAPANEAAVMTDLVDLIFKRQLATERGIELTPAQLDAAVAADGTFPEARRVEALIVLTAEQEQGEGATEMGVVGARERAAAAVEELRAGASAEDLVETYGPVRFDAGYVTDGSVGDEAWNAAIFALDEGGVTDPVEAPTGEQLVGVVTDIVPPQPDEGFVEAVNERVGEDVHRRNVELEATAAELERSVTEEAVAADYDQVHLAEILVERTPGNPDDSVPEVRVSHILYIPDAPLDEDGEPTPVAELPEDDPAWEAARQEAEQAATDLRAIEDVEARAGAFASRAEEESDGPTAGRGGDLGFVAPGMLVPEFDAILFETEEARQRGDVLGPVRTQFGWHVILFQEERPSLDDRLAAVQAALAADDADFGAVAAQYSDGPTAEQGGELGWRPLDDLDDDAVLAVSVVEAGEVTEPIDEGDGYRLYQLLDRATRPLEGEALAELEARAFADWYDERYFEAEDGGRIDIDDAVYG